MVKAPCGRIDCTSEFEKLYASEFDKPKTPGKKVGELSSYKYWEWAEWGEWSRNSDFMYEY